ncbi:hypothetical protein KQI61_15345 [Anaerocolumna aminovalerica]|uniref:hypothetical protein n=1 Tax=Anaerocolumna aminovalerica TaxID=1527 RepID=UPI001C0EF94C|nr:hypothetical protein [Anaerocolumna aminovalerica]MBU5333573.1 hypothetical protein [Anaerocolumna aminovalerica]
MKTNFDVTVAICPDGISLKNDIKYIKSTLLYADTVNIISPITYTYSQLTQYKNSVSEKDAIKLAKICIPFCKCADQSIGDQADYAFNYLEKNYKLLTNLPMIERMQFKKQMLDFINNITNVTTGLMGKEECEELELLINTRNVNIVKFDSSLSDSNDRFVNEFLKKLVLSIDNSFPLFDKQANDIMGEISSSNVININNTNKYKIKDTAFTNDLILGLPSFENMPVDEILDIKKEFRNSLVRFRSKMLEYSKDIQNLPWNDEFEEECKIIYNQKILPSIIEIDEATKENNFIKNVSIDFISDKSTLGLLNKVSIGIASSGLITYLTKIAKMDKSILMGTGITAGLSTISKITNKYKEYKENRAEIEKKDLFFYYTLMNRK